jgi:DNA recombination protein RmuC
MVIAFAVGVLLGAGLAVLLLRYRHEAGTGPLFARFDAEMRALETERGRLTGELTERLRSLGEEQARAARQTQSLATALRRPGVRGRWGETTLRNVIEDCGLAEHCDFSTQVHVSDADGAARPDLVVRLPGHGSLVVDAKVPLDAYLDAVDAVDENAAEPLLAKHVQTVRARVSALAAKAYWKRFERAPEMVVMFIPSEAAVSVAAQRDPQLLADAAKQRVMIATPTTMVALLQVVALGWREESISHHAENVRALGAELARRLGTFAEHLNRTSRGLESAVRAHNQAIGSFEGRLRPTAQRMGALGISEASGLQSPAAVEQAVRHPMTAKVEDGILSVKELIDAEPTAPASTKAAPQSGSGEDARPA